MKRIETHTDERRTLVDIPLGTGAYKVLKAHQNCVVGNHYHALKTETFFVIEGTIIADVMNTETEEIKHHILTPDSESLIVAPFDAHRFKMPAGAVLACVSSHQHNPEDDYHFPF